MNIAVAVFQVVVNASCSVEQHSGKRKLSGTCGVQQSKTVLFM